MTIFIVHILWNYSSNCYAKLFNHRSSFKLNCKLINNPVIIFLFMADRDILYSWSNISILFFIYVNLWITLVKTQLLVNLAITGKDVPFKN